MPGIYVREHDSMDKVLKLLKKQIEKAGVVKEVKDRQWYSKPSIKKKKKSADARRRAAKIKRKMG